MTHNPLHRSGRAALPHPALASGESAEAHEWIGMTDAERWQPRVDIADHPFPRQMMALATALKGPRQSRPIAWRNTPRLLPFMETPSPTRRGSQVTCGPPCQTSPPRRSSFGKPRASSHRQRVSPSSRTVSLIARCARSTAAATCSCSSILSRWQAQHASFFEAGLFEIGMLAEKPKTPLIFSYFSKGPDHQLTHAAGPNPRPRRRAGVTALVSHAR
jgi:hypothetical protein